MVDHLTLPGCIGMKEITSPKRFPREPWLLRSEKGGDSYPGSGSSELHYVIRNSPRSAMWSGAGPPPISCTPHWGRLCPELGDVGCCGKEPYGSYSCICSLLPYSRSWGRTSHTYTQGVLCFGARRGCVFGGRTNTLMGLISIKTTRICLLTSESNLCWFSKGYTPRSATRPPLSGVTTGDISHGPGAREVHYEYQSLVITQVSLQLALLSPPNHLTPLPGFRSCEQIPHHYKQLYHSLTPQNGQRHFIVHPTWNRTSSPAAL